MQHYDRMLARFVGRFYMVNPTNEGPAPALTPTSRTSSSPSVSSRSPCSLARSSLHRPRAFPAIFVGGVIAGILDLAYAIVVYTPTRPILIPQTIATGVLGPNSYHGGIPTAVLGVILHFVIALGAATVFYLASRWLPFAVARVLLDRPILSGMIFGACVYLFMHWVVLPLSLVPDFHPSFLHKATEFVEHWFFVGLPISLSVRHYSR